MILEGRLLGSSAWVSFIASCATSRTAKKRSPEKDGIGLEKAESLGGIAKSMARKVKPWDMKVLYHKRNRLSPKGAFPTLMLEDS